MSVCSDPGHIHFILVRRVPPVPSPVLVEVTERLSRRGYTVSGSIPEETVTRVDGGDLGAELTRGLVLLKSHTELALSLAALVHGEGVPLLNPYENCVLTQDKVTACRRLAVAGVPVPATWAVSDMAVVEDLLERGPLVLKPVRGHRGIGVEVVRRPDELAAMSSPHGAMVVQDFVPGPGYDLKVYVIGDDVFAVRKAFAADSFTRPGRPVPVSEEVTVVARRCGAALGLGLYGLDVIESDDGPVVVDVNYFPGYKGVDGAAPRIADYIDRYARGEIDLRPSGVVAPAGPGRLATTSR